MKKVLCVLAAVGVLLSLTACGGSPFEKCRKHAISIGERYLAFEITDAEAIVLLGSIRVPETEGKGQMYLGWDIDSLIRLLSDDDSTYEEIEEKVEDMRSTTLY